jgi:DHA1 family tetracycline resistance protein-like MFS transporter
MMFALLTTSFVGAVVMPATNAFLSHRIPAGTQGELQGAIAGLFSLSAIASPPLMTQLFGYFSSPRAPVHFPGAAFFFAWLLSLGSLALFRWAVAEPAEAASAG